MDDAASRIPTLQVRTSCDGAPALIERYARDVGTSGVFVRTRETPAVGTRVRFEFLLADGRCALAGEGRVTFLSEAAEPGDAGIGIAIETLRRGDRAVVERMTAARKGTPSRFEDPSLAARFSSRPPLRAETLFADVRIEASDAPEASAAYRSTDVTTDLSTVRPPPSARAQPSSASEPPAFSADLADELEPALERSSALDDLTPAFVELEELPPLSAPPAPPHQAPAPADAGASDVRRSDPVRDERFARLVANAAREEPPRAGRGGLLVFVLVLALAAFVAWSGALDPWLGR